MVAQTALSDELKTNSAAADYDNSHAAAFQQFVASGPASGTRTMGVTAQGNNIL